MLHNFATLNKSIALSNLAKTEQKNEVYISMPAYDYVLEDSLFSLKVPRVPYTRLDLSSQT
jgi:hypothetical protein